MAVDQPEWSAGTATVAVDQPDRPVAPFPQVKVHDEEKYMTSADKALDPMREVRAILWTLLVAATLASVAANIAHALVTHGLTLAAVGPVLFAMLAPVALLGLFHLMAAWTRAAADRSAVFWFFLGAIVLLAGAAFRLSFAAIRDLAIGYGYGWADAALFPLILDGLIAVCTVGLVAATRPRRKAKAVRPTLPQRVRAWWRSAPADAEQPVQAVQTPVHHVEDADALTYPDTLTWLAPVHQPVQPAVEQAVHQSTETAPEPVEQAGAPTVTSDNEVVHRPGALVHQEVETEAVHTEERHLVAVQSQPVRQRTTESEQVPVVQPVHREQAEVVVQAGASELPVETIAAVYARLDAGHSQTAIDRAKVANKRTVAKLIAARAELAAEVSGPPSPRPLRSPPTPPTPTPSRKDIP
ncbi:DUF2637 domain-containing protein [Tsukamurella pseudospumae]|uniref:DUF2637 domain-containing protein n=1 Tax=Tsukamurella pseudospumae TaxID=239498 RepID=A0A138AUA9_9ACTN|nr:DUF2637 domain-containing protein [Tsukamurella pseudospumae]KXO98950.1 hypothetical protein AXK61_18580 [Tsukamurella pseudospumae]KXP14030.1 hypothetical protein AXK60_22510 [Tsukamurella pseudospumae]